MRYTFIEAPYIISSQGYFGKDGQVLDGMDGNLSFFEENGKRWFRTGDIGEFDDEGEVVKETIILNLYLF